MAFDLRMQAAVFTVDHLGDYDHTTADGRQRRRSHVAHRPGKPILCTQGLLPKSRPGVDVHRSHDDFVVLISFPRSTLFGLQPEQRHDHA
jgi:hypothetical protein